MKPAPIVNLNTNALIKQLVGEYNAKTESLIHAIADNEKTLMKDCQTMTDYEKAIKDFIETKH